VQQWPQPKSVTEVRSFLGLANFYRRFVRDYSRIALPLTELTKDTVPWKWGAEQQQAFDALKAALCSPPVLLVPDQSKPFVLNTDACKYAIGATLQQDHGNGLQPVAYFSAKMSDAERNYDVREQEFMALVRACQHWRHYLHGTERFQLLTDHDSLKYHKTMDKMSGRLARWIEQMSEFHYDLAHIPGKDNVVADALSRRADLAAMRALPTTPPRMRSILKKAATFRSPNRFDTLATAQADDEAARTLQSSSRGEDTPQPHHLPPLNAIVAAASRDRHFERACAMTMATVDATTRRSLRQTPSRRSARAAEAASAAQPERSSARAGRSVVIAPAANPAEAAHQGDVSPRAQPEALISAMRQAASDDEQYQKLLQSPPPGMRAERGLLLHDGGRIRVPAGATLRTRILAELHDTPTGAHCGRDRLLSELHRRFSWNGMATDAEQYVLSCHECQINKHSKQLRPGLLMPLPLPEEPCLHWTTDAVTGLPKTKSGSDAIQVYVDRLTKLKRFAPARTSDGSVQLANTTLRTIIGPHGMPKSMVSDRDPRITAKFWKELSRLLGSTVSLSTAYHPESDGQSEREIQTLITALRNYANAMGDDWDVFLPSLELAFNSKQQASTGASPFTLVYGQDARLPIDCALDDARPVLVPVAGERAARMQKSAAFARSKAEIAQERQKQAADRHRRLLQLKAGDLVLLSTEALQLRSGTHKLTGRYIGPFAVTGCVNNNAVTLELSPLLGALHPTVNISRLKLYRDGRTLFPTRPQRVHQPPAVSSDTNGVARYEVESVLAQRGSARRRELLVRWKGWGPEHDEWQRRSELTADAPDAVAEFDARQRDGALHAAQLRMAQQ
jgi:hypothetical protein